MESLAISPPEESKQFLDGKFFVGTSLSSVTKPFTVGFEFCMFGIVSSLGLSNCDTYIQYLLSNVKVVYFCSEYRFIRVFRQQGASGIVVKVKNWSLV